MAESRKQILPPTRSVLDQLEKLVKKANQGAPEAIRELQQFLDEHPQIWQRTGDMAQIAEIAWIELISKGRPLCRESLKKKLTALKEEIGVEAGNPLDDMLVEVIISTWLEMHYLRSVEADTTFRTGTQNNSMIKRLESAQRRHITAIKQYRQIQKLLPNTNIQTDLKIFRPKQETG
ncbi:hypothetical protein [Gimesia sp.]|uniref:hypothetical protein n=1 Tax=Gimesia sp. TaxID=2024833 RepID=UPI003A914ACD